MFRDEKRKKAYSTSATNYQSFLTGVRYVLFPLILMKKNPADEKFIYWTKMKSLMQVFYGQHSVIDHFAGYFGPSLLTDLIMLLSFAQLLLFCPVDRLK